MAILACHVKGRHPALVWVVDGDSVLLMKKTANHIQMTSLARFEQWTTPKRRFVDVDVTLFSKKAIYYCQMIFVTREV